MRIKVANYAINSLLYALECSSVDEVACTKEDNNLIIVYTPKSDYCKKDENKGVMCGNTATILVRKDKTL